MNSCGSKLVQTPFSARVYFDTLCFRGRGVTGLTLLPSPHFLIPNLDLGLGGYWDLGRQSIGNRRLCLAGFVNGFYGLWTHQVVHQLLFSRCLCGFSRDSHWSRPLPHPPWNQSCFATPFLVEMCHLPLYKCIQHPSPASSCCVSSHSRWSY